MIAGVRARIARVAVITLLAGLVAAVAGPAGATATTPQDEGVAQAGTVLAEPNRDLTGQLLDRFLSGQSLSSFQESFHQGTDEFGRPTGLNGLYETTNFRVFYDNDPNSSNYSTDAFATETGDVFEEVYAVEITGQGWSRPADDGARGGDGRIDVYMLDLTAMGAYGFAAPDNDAGCDPARCVGLHGWMGMENDFVGYPPDPPGALRATVAHEFHHLIQFNESASNDSWMFEATATWEESVVFPDIDARTFYIDSFVTEADQPLTVADGTHEYGAYVFMRWLADRFGIDVIRDAWRATLDHNAYSMAGIDAALQTRGTTASQAFARFSADTVDWNTDGFPRDIINGTPVTYPDLPRQTELADGDTTTVTLDHTAYVVYPTTAADAMGARLTGPAGVNAAVSVVASSPAGVRIATGAVVNGVAVANLSNTGGSALFVVVANTDITAGPVDANGRTYPADGSQFSLEVGGQIVAPTQTGLVDGGRIEAVDAVSQAIATSQSLFADGSARQVVLATAERFPDALAGAALAGSRGPILFTPFTEALDTRTAAEIARVTGGKSVVLILGGTAAVTDAAAGQARAAGGDVACTAPVPTNCRYAGSGREATAALIADTVVAQNPGDTALIARGDAFADALTGGAFAARAGVPVLLTPSTSPNDATAAFLTANPQISRIVILGGEAAVDQATATALGATERVSGPERTATAVAIATELWGTSGNGAGGVVLVNVRADNAWPTALAAAVASAVYDAPQIGVENPPAALGDSASTYLAQRTGPVQAYGNPTLVSDAQLQAAVAAGG